MLGVAQLLIVLDADAAPIPFLQIDGEHAASLPLAATQAALAEGTDPAHQQPRWLPTASPNGHAPAKAALPPGCSAYARLPLLLVDGTPFGYLAALDTRRTGWPSADRDVLLFAASLIGNIAASPAPARTDTSTAHQTRQLHALAATALALASASGLPAILAIITEQARLIIEAHLSETSLPVNARWTQAVSSVSLSERYAGWRTYAAASTGEGIYALVCQTNRPLRLTQAELVGHPAWRGFGAAAAQHPPLRGLLAVPLIGHDGDNLGVLQVSDKDAGEFTEEDETVLIQLAQLAVAALEQTHLQQLAQAELQERRRVEAELRESESGFRYLFHNSPQPMWVVDMETLAFLEVNAAALAQYGYTREEFLTLHVADIRPSEEVPRVLAAFSADPPGYTEGEVWCHRTRDGRLLDVAIYFHVITFAGRPAHLTAAIDVTRQRQAEARLREDAARLSALVATQQAVATAEPDVRQLMALVAEQTQALTGADGAAIEIVEGAELVQRTVTGTLLPFADRRLSLHNSLSGLCVRQRQPLRSDDITSDPRVHADAQFKGTIRSVILAPLHYDGQTFGILKAAARATHAFDDRTMATLQLLAGLAAAVLGRASAFAAKQALIAERTATLAALQESEERFRQLAEYIKAAFWIAEGTARHTLICYISPAYEEIWGRPCAELLANPGSFFASVHPDDRERLIQRSIDWSAGQQGSEFRIVRPDGVVRWIWGRGYPIPPTDGGVYRIAGLFEDITERKAAEAQLAHLAYHDPLTQLPNRLCFTERLTALLEQSAQRDDRPAVFFIDIDRFKVINDSLGHEIGDRLLVAVAERLRASLRAGELIARLGGDEFTILLEGRHSLEEVLGVARRIIAAVERPLLLAGREVVVTISLGIVFNPVASTPTEVMRDADVALYQAKARGRGCFALFDQEMNNRALSRLDLEADLRRALHERQFSLVYQPILALTSRRIVGVEALIRWHHPERGLIAPLDFIPIAEEIGLIVPIGRWVLAEACQQLSAWQRAYPATDLTLSINLSAREFAQPDTVETIAATLAANGLAPHHLQIEITESVLMEDAQATILTLEALNALNVRLAADDFGTGYSSLAYLKRFPLDVVKIDQLFIAGLEREGDDAAIVRAIITLAHALGLAVVAEGVEGEAQARLLIELGCEYGQGYHFARPLPPEALATLLATAHAVN